MVVITGRTIVVEPVCMTAFCTCPEVARVIGDDDATVFFGGVCCGGIVMVVVRVETASSSSPEIVTGFTASRV